MQVHGKHIKELWKVNSSFNKYFLHTYHVPGGLRITKGTNFKTRVLRAEMEWREAGIQRWGKCRLSVTWQWAGWKRREQERQTWLEQDPGWCRYKRRSRFGWGGGGWHELNFRCVGVEVLPREPSRAAQQALDLSVCWAGRQSRDHGSPWEKDSLLGKGKEPEPQVPTAS